jgi:uridine kinase
MHTSTERFVIAVAGPSGAGKSTLVKELVRELKDAVALSFDDYHPNAVPSTSYPKDLAQWLAEGAHPDSWTTPQMIADLQALLYGKTIATPDNKSMLEPATFIVMEEPFGRARTPMKKLVNYVIAVNTPLEVALARRLLREAGKPHFKEHPHELGSSMLNYLQIYLEIARPLYLAANEHVYKDCNLILDGLKPLPEIVDEAVKQVRIAASLLPVRSDSIRLNELC